MTTQWTDSTAICTSNRKSTEKEVEYVFQDEFIHVIYNHSDRRVSYVFQSIVCSGSLGRIWQHWLHIGANPLHGSDFKHMQRIDNRG